MHDLNRYNGYIISNAAIDEECLTLTLDPHKVIAIYDNREICCESRYMRTDDDVKSLIGHTLVRIEEKESKEIEGFEVHEICFVEVGTDKGFITLVNHNEHNGYHAGFSIAIKEIKEITNASPQT